MKKAKSVFTILLAVACMLAFTVTAHAEGPDLSDHSYKAFQIFKGTQSAGSADLAVTGWGDGIKSADFLTELKASEDFGDPNPFASVTDAPGTAAVVTGWADKSDEANAFAAIAYRCRNGSGADIGETLDPGYYLVVDVTDLSNKTNEVRNLALLQLTQKSTFTAETKVDIPAVIKKVKDINDSVPDSLTGWQDSADYDIGDKVPFKLEATLPSDLENYPEYQLIFHDKECTGLTFDSTSVKVYIGESETPLDASDYTVITSPTDDCTFEVKISDIQTTGADPGDAVRVEYTSTLNTDAVLGSLGNPNTVYLEYSNNANWSLSGTAGQSGGPGGPESLETGVTPEDKVIVFTYKITINKVDDKSAALAGADFELDKFVADENGAETYGGVKGDWVALTKDTASTTTVFCWKGVDDGIYKLKETTVPSGYTGMTEQIFEVTATHDASSDDPKLTDLSGNALSGTITFSRGTTTATDGELSSDVINKKGSLLPETGGIGTTIFYVIGGILVAAAVIILIARRRSGTK